MAIIDAFKNKAARTLIGNLIGVQGNLASRARRGPTPSDTGGITGTARRGINLSYPLGVESDEQQGHYKMFMINKTTPGTLGTGVKAGPAVEEVDEVGDPHLGFQGKNFIDSNLNAGSGKATAFLASAPKLSGLHTRRAGTTRLSEAITLYMPPSVKVSYKSNYKNDEISARASAMADTLGSVIDVMTGGATDSWKKGWEATKKVGGTVGEGFSAVAAFAGKAMAETAAPGAVTLAQLSAGAILGSKMEVMFTDVGRRNFSFSFNFIPKSEKESIMVYKIVQTFKEHMLPEYLTGFPSGVKGLSFAIGPGRVLSIPDTFDIFYFYRNDENPFLNRISTCYLNSMDIDYGGEKYVTYEPTILNGQYAPPPQRTNITLSFTEIETITRERAKQGF